jgi:hypothetical protein
MLRKLARPLRLLIEFIGGFIAAAVVLWLLLIWRLNAAPVNLAFLTPYTETAITDLVPGTQAAVTSSALTWDNTDHSITLHAEGIKLNGPNNAPIADIPALDIRISVFGLIIGQLIPAGLRIEHPQVWIDRAADGTLLFGGMPASSGASNNLGNGREMKGTLAHIADEIVHDRLMRRLEIKDAVFSIHDEAAGNDWSLALADTVLARHLGGELTGDAKIKITQGARTTFAVLHYHYDRSRARHAITANISGINPATLADPGSKPAIINLPLTGEVSFAFDDKLDLTGGAVDMRGDAGTLVYPDFWGTPRAVKSLDLKAGYDRTTGRLDVTKAVIDFGGPKLSVTLAGRPPAAEGVAQDLAFDLGIKLTALPMNNFASIWPKSVIPGARDWIAASLSKGTFDNGEATFHGALKWNDLVDMQITSGSGTISASGATVSYLEGMPPSTSVNAKADFDLDHMTVTVSGDGTGDLKLQPSTITLTDFQKDTQNIDLPIKFAGPLPAVLKLIDVPRFRYAQAIGLSPGDVSGTINGMVEMKFPLLKNLLMKDADIKAGGDITDLASSSLVKGLDISEGDLTLTLDKSGFALNGKAAIQKIPLLITWQQSFDENSGKPLKHATLNGDVSGEQWGRLGVDALSDTQGPIAVSLEMTENKKKVSAFTGTLDMKKAAMNVVDLDWKKPAGAPAMLSFIAQMPEGKDMNVTSIVAQGPGLNIKGKAIFVAADLKPASVDLNPFMVGRTDASLHFAQAPGASGKLSFAAEGNAFDVSGLRGGKDPGRSDPRPKEYHLKLKKLITSDFGFIANISATAMRDAKGWGMINLHGMADGGHELVMNLAPQPDGHRTLEITCDDFGKALKGLGFTDAVKDGKLKINGASTTDNPRLIEGKVGITHFQVKDLPALVVLLNATSPFGIFNLFNGTLDFDHLNGKFRWQGDTIDLDDVHASGDSVGMTIDGKVDMNTGQSDVHGTMAPFSMFNRVIGSIPLIGDMLTGGEGQGVLGVTYTIKGPLAKPDVSVNAASLLTPGFLRNLFFGGGDSDEEEEKAPEGSSANPAPREKPAPPPASQAPTPPAITNFNK